MKRIIAVILMISVLSMFPVYSSGESIQPLCYNISIDSTNKKQPVIYVTTTNADSRNSISAALVLNDGQTKVTGAGKTVNITGSQTVFTLQIPDITAPGEYYMMFSSSNMQITAQSMVKYVLLPQAGNVPNVSVSSTSHEQGRAKEITVWAAMAVSNFTGASVYLLNSQGKQVSGVTPVTGSFNGGNSEIKLNIPSSVLSGDYKIRVQVLGVYKDIPYSITPQVSSTAAPEVNSIDTSGTNLIAGAINGNVIITGKNFSPVSSRNSIELIGNSGSRTGSAIIPDISTSTSLSFLLPSDLPVGTYKVRITVEGLSTLSTGSITVKEAYASVSPTPAAGGTTPLINSISLSQGAVNVEGTIGGRIIALCSGFLSKPDDNRLHIIDAAGLEKATVFLDSSSTTQRLVASIPSGLLAGQYKVKIIVNSTEYIGSSSFNILKDAPPTPPNVPFSITGIDVSAAVLIEGEISGNIIIKGDGFSGIPSLVELINEFGVAEEDKASVVSYTSNNILIRLPGSVKKGTYKLRVTISGQSLTTSAAFEVISRNNGQDVLPYGNTIPGIMQNTSPTPPPVELTIDNPKTTFDQISNTSVTEINGYQIASKLGNADRSKKIEVAFELPDTLAGTNDIVFGTDAMNAILSNNLDVKIVGKEGVFKLPADFFKDYPSYQIRFGITTASESEESALIESVPVKEMEGIKIRSAVIDFKIFTENGPVKKAISSFNSNIKLEFNLEGLNEGLDVRKIGLYYFDEVKKTWIYSGGKYNAETKRFEGSTRHFSKFSVLEYTRKFADVGDNHWAKDYIEVMASKHVVNGVGNNLFLPDGKVKRCEFAAMLVKHLGIPLDAYQGKFKDVKPNDWFKLYVEALARSGIVAGTGNGNFSPNMEITNQEMAVMIMNAFKYINGKDYKSAVGTSKSPYSDTGKIASWAKEQVIAANALGIIDGKPGDLFNPKYKASRADTCKIIYNLGNAKY